MERENKAENRIAVVTDSAAAPRPGARAAPERSRQFYAGSDAGDHSHAR